MYHAGVDDTQLATRFETSRGNIRVIRSRAHARLRAAIGGEP